MATAAAAIIGKARRDVISYFLQRNAVSANAAVTWVPERNVQRRMLARFLRNGVVIEEAPDTYFVDVATYDRWRRECAGAPPRWRSASGGRRDTGRLGLTLSISFR